MERQKFDIDIEEIRPTIDTFIGRRICNEGFAQIVVWMCKLIGKGLEYVTVRDVRKFKCCTRQRANDILNDMSEVGLLKKEGFGGYVEYYFIKSEEGYLITKYWEKAMRTLGLTTKIVITKKKRDNNNV